ncbi:MAG: indolepyruvate oxidoreductase subunit beta [Candidatus Rifleibacteriota bacterium]
MGNFNIYLCGVGGQGIGLISEVILRAVNKSGQNAVGVDTHGLAQRGGVVASQIRIGESVYSPVVAPGTADLVISLETTEALRGAAEYCKPYGTLVYYKADWQPLPVRLGKAKPIKAQHIEDFCSKNLLTLHSVLVETLPDPRMQNIALLAEICKKQLVPGVNRQNYQDAMSDLMNPEMLEANLKIFNQLLT